MKIFSLVNICLFLLAFVPNKHEAAQKSKEILINKCIHLLIWTLRSLQKVKLVVQHPTMYVHPLSKWLNSHFLDLKLEYASRSTGGTYLIVNFILGCLFEGSIQIYLEKSNRKTQSPS